MSNTGSVIDKAKVREVVRQIGFGEWWTPSGVIDDMAVEQATNKICALQRPPRNIEEVALTVHCPYCGRTAGNRCHKRGGGFGDAHPSRIRESLALKGD